MGENGKNIAWFLETSFSVTIDVSFKFVIEKEQVRSLEQFLSGSNQSYRPPKIEFSQKYEDKCELYDF